MLYRILKWCLFFSSLPFLGACSSSSGDSSQSNTQVVFRATVVDKAGAELFSTDLSGNVKHISKQLADNGLIRDFSLSQLSGKVAFVATGEGTLSNLYTYDLCDDSLVSVTNFDPAPEVNRSPFVLDYEWNANGTWLAFIVEDRSMEKNRRLNLYSPEQNRIYEQIPSLQVRDLLWSPDGTRLAFVGINDIAEELSGIFIWDSETLVVKELADNIPDFDLVYLQSGGWSSDGRYLIFGVDGRGSNNSTVGILDLQEDIQANLSINNLDVLDRWKWAPDGTKLALISEADSLDQRKLFVVQADTQEAVRVSPSIDNDETVDEVLWSPDSEELIYFLSRLNSNSSVFRVEANGSNVELVSGDLNVYGMSSAFSGDGRWLAFGAFGNIANEQFIYNRLTGDVSEVRRQDGAPYTLGSVAEWSNRSDRFVFEGRTQVELGIYVGNILGELIRVVEPSDQDLATIGEFKLLSSGESVLYHGSELISGPSDLFVSDVDDGVSICLTCGFEGLNQIADFDFLALP